MDTKEKQEKILRLRNGIEEKCLLISSYYRNAENKESRGFYTELSLLCREAMGFMSVMEPALLIALMDAYEITRDEKMLQGVLDVVGRSLERLKVSAESVKLLSYCWYYVEEKECAERARQMLEELKRSGKQAEVVEAEQVYEDMVGE